ncbi:MAG TPA: hypothetical protein VM243_04420 [Phycisphaerae bacterium]|nr:hypothetical protein [Phycisphaerae bacterium]
MMTIVRWVLNWLYANASAKVYTSRVPVGRHLGGKDAPELPDHYIILDVRAGGRILVLGYFQTT